MTIPLSDEEVDLILRALHQASFRVAEIAVDLGVRNDPGLALVRLADKIKFYQSQEPPPPLTTIYEANNGDD